MENPWPSSKKEEGKGLPSRSGKEEEGKGAPSGPSSKEEVKGGGPVPQIYILYPGNMTGDIYHAVGAQILYRNEKWPVPVIVFCVSVPNKDREDDETVKLCGELYDYVRNLNLPGVLVQIGVDTKDFNNFVDHQITDQFLDGVIKMQISGVANILSYEEAFKAPESLKIYHSTTVEGGTRQRCVSLPTTTTMAMQFFERDDHATVSAILRDEMAKGYAEPEDFPDPLLNKIETLTELIRKADRPVLLFNYRTGSVNKQHDASPAKLRQVMDLADARGLRVIKLLFNWSAAAEDVSDGKEEDIKKIQGIPAIDIWIHKYKYPKAYTAALWASVYNEKDLKSKIFGIIGWRSGSMDLPRFLGFNCLSWDEPFHDEGC